MVALDVHAALLQMCLLPEIRRGREARERHEVVDQMGLTTSSMVPLGKMRSLRCGAAYPS